MINPKHTRKIGKRLLNWDKPIPRFMRSLKRKKVRGWVHSNEKEVVYFQGKVWSIALLKFSLWFTAFDAGHKDLTIEIQECEE